MLTINDELTKAFGVDTNWSTLIFSCILSRAGRIAKRGYLDDLFVDITSELIVKSKTGGFAIAISKAKDNSSTDDELLKNIKNVVKCAVFYRISNAIRTRYDKKSTPVPFSQLNEEFDFSIKPKTNDGLDLLIDELKSMIQEQPDHSDRYELAITILLERLSGWSQTDLNKKHDLTEYQVKLLNKDWNVAFSRMERQ